MHRRLTRSVWGVDGFDDDAAHDHCAEAKQKEKFAVHEMIIPANPISLLIMLKTSLLRYGLYSTSHHK